LSSITSFQNLEEASDPVGALDGWSFGAVLPGLALVWVGWNGVVGLCLLMVLVAIGADIVLC